MRANRAASVLRFREPGEISGGGDEHVSPDEKTDTTPSRATKPEDPLDAAQKRREVELLDEVRAGDADAFGYFVRTYQKRIFRLAFALLRDAAEADCVTQDVFVKAYRALADFKGDSAFETWLTRIAINTVRDRVRRRRPVVSFSQMGSGAEGESGLPRGLEPADAGSPERDLMSRDIRRRIAEALLDLSPRQRSVFVMKHYEEKTIAEIGEATGLDEGTIKSHLFRAARKLRARLEDLR